MPAFHQSTVGPGAAGPSHSQGGVGEEAIRSLPRQEADALWVSAHCQEPM